MKLTGSEILIECLKAEGVKTIFALPGGVVLKIFDMLHQQKDIEVVLTRHEQGAGHMAEGYAKATGKAKIFFTPSAFKHSIRISDPVSFISPSPSHIVTKDAMP